MKRSIGWPESDDSESPPLALMAAAAVDVLVRWIASKLSSASSLLSRSGTSCPGFHTADRFSPRPFPVV